MFRSWDLLLLLLLLLLLVEKVRAPGIPAAPSAKDRADHSLTHVPYRSWCGWCVKNKATEKAHSRKRDEEGLPKIHIDFTFVGKTEDEMLGKILNMVDKGSGSMNAIYCHTKAFNAYTAQYDTIVLKGDQEKVLIRFAEVVAAKRARPVIVRLSQRGSHQEQGTVELGNRILKGQLRTIWSYLEDALGAELPSTHLLIAWAVRHASWLITRFQVKDDGRTPIARIFHKAYQGEVVCFGESVMFKLPMPERDLEQRWGDAVGRQGVQDG